MIRIALCGLTLLALACQPAPVEPPAETINTTTATQEPLSSFDPQVDELLAEMTLDEKLGQMNQPANTYLADDEDVGEYFLGSVLSGGGQDPSPENNFEDWRDMVGRYQKQAQATRLGIPILYGVDAVHGHNNVVGAVIFPQQIGLGATANAELVEKVYRATAIEVRATGINWNFTPCVAVPRDERWGRTYEGFSESPKLVAELGYAAVKGLQGEGLGDPLGVLACAKHYLADGGTTFGTGTLMDEVPDSVFADGGGPEGDVHRWPLDRGDAQMDEATLREIHLPGYLTAIEAGVGSIMPSFSSWNGEYLSGHKYLLTDLLKDELGFEGFLISDWAAINDLDDDYKKAIELSINAGMDMVMVPDHYQSFAKLLKENVEEGVIPMERIDDAVRRILRVKFAMGLMEEGVSLEADPALAERFGSAEHRELGRQAVRESMVLLENKEAALPLAKDLARIHVAGKNADNLGHQCGGWTIDWQGGSGDITEGTTILEAVQGAVSADTEVTYSIDGEGAEGADVVIVVVGEGPYAEMQGDRTDLHLDEADAAAVENAARTGAPVVLVVVSGRPMILEDVLESSQAVVAAWLPGTEGEGVADVLFGDFNPTGKLSFTWPRSMDQIPMNVGDEDYDPLFAFGHGLTYP